MDISYLFTPALKVETLAKQKNLNCCVQVLDLEDSIHPSQKSAARSSLLSFDFSRFDSNSKLSIRINALSTLDGLSDIQLLQQLCARSNFQLDSVFLPKINNHHEVKLYRSLFNNFAPNLKLIPLIETLDAIADLDNIAAHSDALLYGHADLLALLYADNEIFISQIRSQVCIYAAKYNIIPIDANSFEFEDMDIVEQQCLAGQKEGFMAKAVIHPKQLDPVNKVFRISEREVSQLHEVIGIYDNSPNGFSIKDNKIIAPPFVAKAQKMLTFIKKHQ